MTTRPFLCNHNEKGAGAPARIEAGVWRSDSQDLLKRLAQTIPPTATRGLADTHSLPDIWGYATLFAAAWEDENHELHGQAIGAWRGLLALVALKDISGLPVTLYALTQARDKTEFLKAAFLHPPRHLFAPNGDAMPLGAILYRNLAASSDEVAGLLLPRLLVLPGREFHFSGHKRIGWAAPFGGGTFPLGDPIDRRSPAAPGPDVLKPNQVAGLIVFLERLEENVRDLVVADDRNRRALSTLLNHITRFHSDAIAVRNATPPPADLRYEILPSDQRTPAVLNTVPLRFLLDRPTRKKTAGQTTETDIAFPFRGSVVETINQPLTPLFYSDGMDEWAADNGLGELRVFDDLFVSETSEQDMKSLESQLRTRGYLLILPEHIFEDRLLEMQVADEAPAIEYQHHGVAKRFLLPFKPLILAFLSPTEIVQALRVAEDANGITVALGIRLRSPRGDIETEVRRYYSRHRGQVRRIGKNMAGTALQIWPNFHARDWRVYLLYQNCGKEDNQPFHAHRLVTEAAISKAFSAGLSEGTRAMESKIDDAAEAGANRTRLSANPRKEVIQTDSCIQAVQAAVGNDKGLLLCSQIEQAVAPPINPGRNWRVGIDFGASNSCVAYSAEPYHAPDTLAFCQDRTVLLTEQPGSPRTPFNPDYAAAIYEFLSPNRVEPPFLSLIQERQPTETTGAPALLSVNRIGYIDTPISWLSQVCGGDRSEYFFGLKWDTTVTARSRVKQFIRQLVLQTSAEARFRGVNPATVDWRITIPGSLPPNIVGRFEADAIESVLEIAGARRPNASGGSSSGLGGPPPIAKVAFPLESTCAFKYVVKEEDKLVGNVQVLLDVGGWSTDVAIHPTGGKAPIWEGSLEIGGQHILVDYWRSEVDNILAFLAETRPEFKSAGLGASGDERCRGTIIEMLLNDAEIADALFRLAEPGQELSDAGNKVLDLIERTKRRADFVLFAIVDYTMYLLNELVKEKLMAADRSIGFFLCGRGSKLFERALSRGGASGGPRNMPEDRLRSLMENVELPHSLDGVAFTQRPKKEVALGAVILRDPVRPTNGTTRRELPLGEPIDAYMARSSAGGKGTLQHRSFKESDHISIADAAGFTNLSCSKLVRLPDFIRRYNRGWGEDRIAAKAAEHAGLVGKLNSLIATHHGDACDAPGADGFLQPPFILAVRAALVNWGDIGEK